MNQHFLLWAFGPDKPGIVSAVSKALYDHGMNLEDSSMMRLGSEFGIFLIFTGPDVSTARMLEATLEKQMRHAGLTVGIKRIARREALAPAPRGSAFLVSVHGPDRPGIVYRVTKALARRKFNITDLSTHRTTRGATAGFILFIEGEMRPSILPVLRRDLEKIRKTLKTKVDVRPIPTTAF